MGRIKHEWQDRDYVLSWFGEKEGKVKLAYQLVKDYGIPLAEVARQPGVSTSAISKAITRRTKE